MRLTAFPITFLFLCVLTLVVGSSCLTFAVTGPEQMGFHLFKGSPTAQEFDMRNLDGSPLRLSELKGRVVLLNFWRRNCRYCEREKVRLLKMQRQLKSEDLKIVCVNLWDQPRWVKRYAGKNGKDLLYATRGKQSRSFVKNEVKGRLLGYFVINQSNEAVYEVKGFPTTYVIDRDGRIIAGHLGMGRWDRPSVSHWISDLIGTRTARADEISAQPAPTRGRESLPTWLDALLSGPAAVDSRRAEAGATGLR